MGEKEVFEQKESLKKDVLFEESDSTLQKALYTLIEMTEKKMTIKISKTFLTTSSEQYLTWRALPTSINFTFV